MTITFATAVAALSTLAITTAGWPAAGSAPVATDLQGPELVSIHRTTPDVVGLSAPDARVAIDARDPQGVAAIEVQLRTDHPNDRTDCSFRVTIYPDAPGPWTADMCTYTALRHDGNVRPQRISADSVLLRDGLGNETRITDRGVLDALAYTVVNEDFDGDFPTVESVSIQPRVAAPGQDIVVTTVLRDASASAWASGGVTGGMIANGQDANAGHEASRAGVANGDGTFTVRDVFTTADDTAYGRYPLVAYTGDAWGNAGHPAIDAALVVDDPAHAVGSLAATGTLRVGNTLGAAVVGWDPAATLAFSWWQWGRMIGSGPSLELGALHQSPLRLQAEAVWPDGTRRVATHEAGYVDQGMLPVAPPVVTGTPTVGSILAATEAIGPKPADWGKGTHRYEWRRDGKHIDYADESTYAPTPADVGRRISVVATHAVDGYAQLVQESQPVVIGPGTLAAAVPTTAGSPRVGQKLAGRTGSWTPGTAFTYQWLRGGKAVPGATARDRTLTAADLNQKVQLRVTGSRAGYRTAQRLSAPQTVAAGVLNTPTPTISGAPRVGAPSLASTAGWTSGTALTYQWQRDGRNIARATQRSYTPQPGDQGHSLRVRIAGDKAGYTKAVRSSVARTVGYGLLKEGRITVPSSRVGQRVVPRVTGWAAGNSHRYQWERNGSRIRGATSRTYIPVQVCPFNCK